MANVLLVHANCVNSKAKGDYAFAASIAADLVREANQHQVQISVVLVSTRKGLAGFHNLYGEPIEGRIRVQDLSIALCALEEFDSVAHKVIGFIDANRCKHPASELLKNLLEPDSKLLVVGNLNQLSYASESLQELYHVKLLIEQPGVYDFFDKADVLIGSAGLDEERLGIPAIKTSKELPALTAQEQQLIPTGNYGFMYLYHQGNAVHQVAVQYINLTNYQNYVLVGSFPSNNSIQAAYNADAYRSPKKQLNITCFPSLNASVMRKTMANAKGPLVATTGVMSTLEAMRDNKLPFYQDMSGNAHFVAAYLLAVRSICKNKDSVEEPLFGFVVELSDLLFAPKPLPNVSLVRAQDILRKAPVVSRLRAVNQEILEQANGKIAHRLLGFLGNPRATQTDKQVLAVCNSLRIKYETSPPTVRVALRRAASQGLLFEVKVLIRSIPSTLLNDNKNPPQHTALHCAVLSGRLDCARVLLAAGADFTLKDRKGKNAMQYAMQAANQDLINVLVEAGASFEVESVNEEKTSGVKRRFEPY